MTQAQLEADIGGISPEETDPRFFAQHLCAYAFARPFARGKGVLEIGFGDGYGANYLADIAKDVVAVDMAPGNIPLARNKYPRSNLHFLHMEAGRLEFQDGAFDLVGTFQVIEHIAEPRLMAFLTGIRRVLTAEGVACISTLNLEHNMKPGRPYQQLCYHEKEFTGPELEALLGSVFPSVELYGLYLTGQHRLCQRLKKWGLNRLGPAPLNPVQRFYDRMSVHAFRTQRGASRTALDLIALCRIQPA